MEVLSATKDNVPAPNLSKVTLVPEINPKDELEPVLVTDKAELDARATVELVTSAELVVKPVKATEFPTAPEKVISPSALTVKDCAPLTVLEKVISPDDPW